jgi:creatinine amidohydrolase
MPLHRLAEMTWPEVRDLDRSSAVAILPVGAVEAHGPHLPLSTDVVIAEGMARECAQRIAEAGGTAVILPPVWYTAAGFARAFPGTVQVGAGTVTALVRDVIASLAEQGFRTVAVANAHLDPGHLASLREACAAPPEGTVVAFVDLTRRDAAERLTDEFRTGACHAGRFEGSVVRAEAPDLYRADVAAALAPNPASLSEAIRAGRSTFAEAGGDDAYFGWPADATADEGRATLGVLGALLAEAIQTAREAA